MANPFKATTNQLQPQPQLHPPLPHNRLERVPFFHMLYKSAMSMGVQLPERTPSMPLPLQLAASNKSIRIQRQLLFPQQENKFISILLTSCTRYVKFYCFRAGCSAKFTVLQFSYSK